MYRRLLILSEPFRDVAYAPAGAPNPVAKAEAPVVTVEPPESVPEPLPTEGTEAKELREMLASFTRLVDEWRDQNGRMVRETAQMSVELGVALAERLLGGHIAADRQRLDRIVVAALERMPSARAVVVRVHPDDLALLKQQLSNAECEQLGSETLTFRTDANLARGQLKLESSECFAEWDTHQSLTELRVLLLEEIFPEA